MIHKTLSPFSTRFLGTFGANFHSEVIIDFLTTLLCQMPTHESIIFKSSVMFNLFMIIHCQFRSLPFIAPKCYHIHRWEICWYHEYRNKKEDSYWRTVVRSSVRAILFYISIFEISILPFSMWFEDAVTVFIYRMHAHVWVWWKK